MTDHSYLTVSPSLTIIRGINEQNEFPKEIKQIKIIFKFKAADEI